MLTFERLKIWLTDPQIYEFYLGDFQLNGKYNAPYRDDPNASLQLKKSEEGVLYWRDYGKPYEFQKGSDAVALVEHMFDCSREEAIQIIWKEMIASDDVIPRVVVRPDTAKLPLKPFYREMQDWEYEYWGEHGISKDTLRLFNVHALTGLYKLDRLIWKSESGNPAYIYVFGRDKFKCYRPLDTTGHKFLGYNNSDVIEGWSQIPEKGDLLIVTKSMKDVMVLYEAGFVSCSPTSENSFRTIVNRAEELNKRFKKIIIFYDNDLPGITASEKLSSLTGWESIMIPVEEGIKDVSDWVRRDGYDKLNKFLKFKI